MTTAKDTETTWLPQYYLLGRMTTAFGILTDEHRTYVRMQSGTSWDSSFDTGLMMSANPVESVHYDISLVNGQKNIGQSLNQNMANIWGAVGNLRWLPVGLPFLIGTSFSSYGAGSQARGATAASVYGLLSLHRLTRNQVPVTISTEVVQAKNWNSTFTDEFVSDSAYAGTLNDSTSLGLYALVEWEISQRFLGQYKFDQLNLDRDYPADAYQRHGIGFKYYFGNNMWTVFRFEKASAGHPSESGGQKLGSLDAVFGLLNISI